MSTLQLTVPAQQAQRSGIKIKAAEVRDWLDDLPYMDLQRAARMASEQLRLMNRQIIPASVRLAILDAFLASHHRLFDALPQRLAGSGDSPQQIKRLTQDIGFGYKIVAQQLAGKSGGKLLNNRTLAAAINGSLYNLGLQLQQYYERRQRAPRAIWDECLMLYRYARTRGFEDKSKVFPDNQQYRIEDNFLIVALLRIADPYRLSPGMIPALVTYLRKHMHLCRLETEQDLDSHLIPLQSADESALSVIYLDPAELLEQLSADIKKLDKTNQATAIGLSAEVSVTTLLRTLQQLEDHWKNFHTRSAERREAHASIELVQGVNASYCVINHGRCFDPGMYLVQGSEYQIDLADPAQEPEYSREETPTPISCYSLNHSGGGLALQYRGMHKPYPAAGQLLAIRRPQTTGGGSWVIGICRWLVEASDGSGFDLGLQYLVREPAAIVVHSLRQDGSGSKYQPAISAEQQRSGQAVSTLIASAEIPTGSHLELITALRKQRVLCTELLESGPGFYRYIYEPDEQP